MKTVIFVILAIIGYSSIAGAWIAGLKIAEEKYVPEFDTYLDLWPGLCGAFWPVGGPAAAAYILVMAYIEENN